MKQTLQLKENFNYKRNDGAIVGPMVPTEKGHWFDNSHMELYNEAGYLINPISYESNSDICLVEEYYGDDSELCQCSLCQANRKEIATEGSTPLTNVLSFLHTLFNEYQIEFPEELEVFENGLPNFFELSMAEQVFYFNFMLQTFSDYQKKYKISYDGKDIYETPVVIEAFEYLTKILPKPPEHIMEKIKEALIGLYPNEQKIGRGNQNDNNSHQLEFESSMNKPDNEISVNIESQEFYNEEYEDECLFYVQRIERVIKLFKHHKNIEIQLSYDGDWTMVELKVLQWLYNKITTFYDNQKIYEETKIFRINIAKFII